MKIANPSRAIQEAMEEFVKARQVDYSRFTNLGGVAVFVTLNRHGVIRRARYSPNAGHFDDEKPEARTSPRYTPFDEAYVSTLEILALHEKRLRGH
jgi:hypothetical protein